MNTEAKKTLEYYLELRYSVLLHQIDDEDDNYWIAEIAELPGCKSHGLTPDEAINNINDAKKEWILDSLESGEDIPIPIERDKYNGKILVRMSKSLHRALAIMSEAESLSINQLIVTILAKEVGRLGVLNRVEEKIDSLVENIEITVKESHPQIIAVDMNDIRKLFSNSATHFSAANAITSNWLTANQPPTITDDFIARLLHTQLIHPNTDFTYSLGEDIDQYIRQFTKTSDEIEPKNKDQLTV